MPGPRPGIGVFLFRHRIFRCKPIQVDITMNSPIRAKALPFAIATLLAVGAAPAIAQNVTSSAVAGQVVDASGQPVANATVTIVHEPSGTTKVVTTDAS